MLSLYEILKASKTGIAPDMWTALAGMNWGGADSGHEVKKLTGIPPLSFTADGTPLLDYLISGNMYQSGTPTPTTPIQPQETGERTGNLFDRAILQNNKGINSSGAVTDTTGRIATVTPIDVSQYTAVTLSYTSNSCSFIFATFNGGTLVDRQASKTSGYTIDVTNCNKLYICFYRASDISTNDVTEIMLNTGSTVLPYEPYGIKIPISSANTTTNIYLGEVETTRKIKKLVLTGEESFVEAGSGGVFRLTLDGYLRETVNVPYCTHYEGEAPVEGVSRVHDLHIAFLVSGSGNNYMYIRDDNYIGHATNLKAYLAAQYAAGTPVTVWYVLATPETAVVNEPLRKIGNYADTLSYEQAGVQIPTNRGNTVIDVLTELKPSEMYIKYQE